MNHSVDMPASKTISLPLVKIDDRIWILLSNVSKAFHFRAVSIDTPRVVKEPSDHRFLQSRAEGSVKCTSTSSWNISDFVSKSNSIHRKADRDSS